MRILPENSCTLRAKLDEIIAAARSYNNDDHGYSDDILISCKRAVDAAVAAIDSSFDESIESSSLLPILFAVAYAERNFEPRFGDDGYGGATFGSIIAELLKLQAELGEATTVTKDQLMRICWSDKGVPIAQKPVDYLKIADDNIEAIQRICRQYGFEKVLVSWHFADQEERIIPFDKEWTWTKLVFQVSGIPADVAASEESCRQSIARLLGIPVKVIADPKLAQLPNRLEAAFLSQANASNLIPSLTRIMYESLDDVLSNWSLKPLTIKLTKLSEDSAMTDSDRKAIKSLILEIENLEDLH